MKKMRAFALRCTKELVRDPISILFSMVFPILILLLMYTIQQNVPVPLFAIESLAPGIAVFGLAFFTLFSAQLIARDRETALLARLYTTPLTAWDFLLGYTLPLLPLSLLQSAVVYGTALLLGLPFSGHVILAWLSVLPAALFFIGLGLLCGSLLTNAQVGGICGGALPTLTAWLSGAWFDLSAMGDGFLRVASVLPFARATALGRALLAGQTEWDSACIVLLWGVVVMVVAAVAFLRQTQKD